MLAPLVGHSHHHVRLPASPFHRHQVCHAALVAARFHLLPDLVPLLPVALAAPELAVDLVVQVLVVVLVAPVDPIVAVLRVLPAPQALQVLQALQALQVHVRTIFPVAPVVATSPVLRCPAPVFLVLPLVAAVDLVVLAVAVLVAVAVAGLVLNSVKADRSVVRRLKS